MIRIEGFSFSVDHRLGELRRLLLKSCGAPDIVEGKGAEALWGSIRDATLLADPRDRAIWRVIEDAFSEWPGRDEETPFEDWKATIADHEAIRPDTTPVVVDGRVVRTLETGDAVRCQRGADDACLVTFNGRDFHAILKSKFGLADR